MIFDFGFLGKGIVIQSVTPEDAIHQRIKFVMYAQTTSLYAKIFMLSEAYQVREKRECPMGTKILHLDHSKSPLYP